MLNCKFSDLVVADQADISFNTSKEQSQFPLKNDYQEQEDYRIRKGDQKRSKLFHDSQMLQPQNVNISIVEENQTIISIDDNELQPQEVNIKQKKKDSLNIIQKEQSNKEGFQNTPNMQFISPITPITVPLSKAQNYENTVQTKATINNYRNSINSYKLGNQSSPNKMSNRNIEKQSNKFSGQLMQDKSSFSPLNTAQMQRMIQNQRLSFFRIVFIINRFIFHIKRVLMLFHPERLNSLQLNLIGDLASQNYEQDEFGIPYSYEQNSFKDYVMQKSINNNNKDNNEQSNSFSQYVSNINITTKSQKEIESLKIKKRKRKALRKVYKILGIHFFSQIIQQFKQKIKKLAKSTIYKIPLIDSNSNFYYIWQTIILICDLIVMIYIPFQISFQPIQIVETYFLNIALPIIYSLNILINLNVSVYYKGMIINSRAKIVKLYFKNCFIYDFIAAVASFSQSFFLLIRYLYSNPLIEQLKSYFILNSYLSAIIQLTSLVIKIFAFSHIFSCFWHSIGLYYSEYKTGWIYEFGMAGEDTYTIYIVCFYYAVVTMSTIGYGDIYAKTKGEMLFMSFAILISSCLFGYTLNAIGTIITELRYQHEICSKKQAKLEEYLSRHQVDAGLRSKARKYIQYIYQQEKLMKKDGQENLKYLNSYLKQEIQKDINSKAFSKAKQIFLGISSNPKFLDEILSIIKEQQYGPEELINLPNQNFNPSLYIIQYGEVELFIKSKESNLPLKTIQFLKTGCIFGQQEFFTNNQINYLQARSVGISYISYIQLSDFESILCQFPEEREKFFMIRDQVLINKQNYLIQDSCLSCRADNHNLQNCPYLFYFPIVNDGKRIQRIVSQVNYQDIAKTKKQFRQRNRYGVLKNLNKLQYEISQYQVTQDEFINIYYGQLDDQDNLDEQDQSFQQTRSKQEEDSESLSQDQNQENVNLSRIRTLSNISLKNSKFQLQNQILFNDLDSQKQRNSHQNSQALSVEKEVSPRKGSYSSKKGSKKSKISHQENERILMPTQLHFDNKLDQRSSDIQIKNIKSEISNEDIILQQQQVKQPAQKNQYQKSVTTYENSQKQTQKKFCRKKRKSFTQINQKNLLQEEQEEIDAMCTKDQINSQESNNFKKLPTNYLNKIHLNNASNDKQLTNLQNIQNVNSHGGNNSSLFPTINLHPNLQYQNSNSLNTINQANIQQPKTQISQSSSHTIYKSKIQNPVIQILPSIINQLNQMFLQNQSSQNTNSQINKNIIDTNINSEELQTLFGKNINSQQKQYMKFNQNAVDGDLIPLNMDIQKNYQFYFPQNNFDKISNVFNQRLKCKLQQKKCSPKRIRRSKNELTLIQDIQLN